MSKTIIAKSDQLNADDLIGKSITVKINKVWGVSDAAQPIAIGYEGDENKPYKPCKSMRRVLVNVWGTDGLSYVGKSMTLYRDDKVLFGGIAVGGIRISAMSGIDKPMTMALTASKANKKPFTVQPLTASKPANVAKVTDTNSLKGNLTIEAKKGNEALTAAWGKLSTEEKKAAVSFKDEIKKMAAEADLITNQQGNTNEETL